jgi:hypothetical protein
MNPSPHLERIAFVNEHDPDSAISAVIDWRVGLIRIVATGFWSRRQTTEHFAAYRQWAERIHASGLCLSLIVDMREAPPQSQEIADILRRGTTGTYRPGDRCAMIVASSIAKLQMRRVLNEDYTTFFVSPIAAETWALAYKQHLLVRSADHAAAASRA